MDNSGNRSTTSVVYIRHCTGYCTGCGYSSENWQHHIGNSLSYKLGI